MQLIKAKNVNGDRQDKNKLQYLTQKKSGAKNYLKAAIHWNSSTTKIITHKNHCPLNTTIYISLKLVIFLLNLSSQS